MDRDSPERGLVGPFPYGFGALWDGVTVHCTLYETNRAVALESEIRATSARILHSIPYFSATCSVIDFIPFMVLPPSR